MRWTKETSSTVDIIAFGAHPDDIELLAGGTIAKCVHENKKVLIIDLTEGELSTNGNVQTRQKETKKATEILNVEGRVNLGFKDGYLNQEHCSEKLVELIRTFKPKVVLSPPLQCRHPDHSALAQYTKNAIFYSGLSKYLDNIPAIERPKWYQYYEVIQRTPDFFIDISPFFKQKMLAIQAYVTQFSKSDQHHSTFINSGFLDSIEHRSLEWGKLASCQYAEAFFSESPPLLSTLC